MTIRPEDGFPGGSVYRIKKGEPFRAVSRSPGETRMIGYAFGKGLDRGDIVYIYGDIGAGKTVFTSGVAAALGIRDYITSPTFTIANFYEGSLPLCHFDAFRIENGDELLETGFFDYSGGNCVVIVEWADRLNGYMPDSRIDVFIETVNFSETERIIRIG